MSRERERAAKKREKNPIVECNKIQAKFYPDLFTAFGNVTDPRNTCYIDYSCRDMLGTVYYKGIAGISSMQEMTRAFNDENVVKNIYQFLDSNEKEYLPHGVTVNEFLERLDPAELENIQADIAYRMIRRKTFDDAKVLGHWLVLVDATELDEGFTQKNENYLSRCYNRGTENEMIKYHRSVLEAKLYLGNGLVCSLATETIENTGEYNDKNCGAEAIKQDCESRAFERIAVKIKKRFPRLPICIVADGLYVSDPVLTICEENDWKYIIRYKEGCAPSIEQEYQAVPEKNRTGQNEYINGIVFGKREVNVLKYSETQVKKGKEVTTDFAWITNFEITDKNAMKLTNAGRNRWKIENQGFNRQKNWQGNIEHACSWNERAQKNHYLLEQISDFIKQLYEYFFLKKNEIKKTQKNISSDLLKSFAKQPTSEDISEELNESALN
jgi:hypothetical protein